MNTQDEYLTVIASQWADPIADIASAWNDRVKQNNYPSHLTLRDQGSCYSIILLLVVMLESYSLRADTGALDAAGDITLREGETSMDDRKSLKLFNVRNWWAKTEYDHKEEVLDVFVIRDVLAHNHLYSYADDENSNNLFVYSHFSGGDGRFNCREKNGHLTRTGMSCIPREIGISEVKLVAKITNQALLFLKNNYERIGIVNFNFARRGVNLNLWDGIMEAATNAEFLINKRIDNE